MAPWLDAPCCFVLPTPQASRPSYFLEAMVTCFRCGRLPKRRWVCELGWVCHWCGLPVASDGRAPSDSPGAESLGAPPTATRPPNGEPEHTDPLSPQLHAKRDQEMMTDIDARDFDITEGWYWVCAPGKRAGPPLLQPLRERAQDLMAGRDGLLIAISEGERPDIDAPPEPEPEGHETACARAAAPKPSARGTSRT